MAIESRPGGRPVRPVTILTALATLLLLAAPGAQAQTRQVPQNREDIVASYAPIVKQVAPAVVNVYGQRRERVRSPLFDDPLFERFFGGGQARERVAQSVGSGVIIGSDGFIVTNFHVIDGMTEVKVALSDRREFEAQVVLRDPRTDLAVMRIKAPEKLAALELGDSDALEVGDLVLAVGNPFGVGQTVTQGIVSALARTQVGISDYQFFIQTDAAINPGNSGGALVDMKGRLVGINSAIYSRTGGSLGIGFAIPVNMVKTVVESARSGGQTVRRPWFGARLQNVSQDVAEAIGLDRPTGALVASVVEGSPAADAGVRTSDVILAVDERAVDDSDSFGYRLATHALGGTATLTLLRGGKRLSVPVKLMVAPEVPARDAALIKGRNPLAGATVVNVSPAVSEDLRLDNVREGVVISEIEDGSPAQQFGFQKGDVLLEINGSKLDNTRRVERVTRERVNAWRMSINRGGQVLTTVFGG